MRNKVSILAGILCFILFANSILKVEASQNGMVSVSDPVIVVDKYTLTEEKVVPGKEFTLTLTIKNVGRGEPAKDIIVDVTNPGGISPVYGTVSQVYVDEIPVGETRDVSIAYLANSAITSIYLDFNVTILADDASPNYVTVRVPVGTDVPFEILSNKFPESVLVGENATSVVSFVVLGDENLKDVSHEVLVDGVVYSSNAIGSLSPGANRTQNTTVAFAMPGEYNVDIVLTYIDKAEEEQRFMISSQSVTVLERENTVIIDNQGNANEGNSDNQKTLILGMAGVIVIAIFLIAVVLRKKK